MRDKRGPEEAVFVDRRGVRRRLVTGAGVLVTLVFLGWLALVGAGLAVV
ncbi:hypothetical protein Lfu02_57310 [Longispora fulva]|uniref:Uncharacterized protein n=1 Tax=Longispora fulva TaxID=619741 RepID=A0A8J7GIW1_9ACTN|nr:hypothetical protein [Longispora fulva]MBG6137288.1 hypothetical protein [Longispora fulva]GIG61359.1 hypothetical protein Lfu02_57310 [Longispora fulva]